MQLIPNELYHVYNQGNNQEAIFRERADYLRFLLKYKSLVAPHCQTLCYCLMPNHFHFLVNTTEKGNEKIKLGGIQIDKLSNGFRLLLSEFASEMNAKYKRTGSVFRQKTKGKLLHDGSENYAYNCFHYIHQNPLNANLIHKLEDWEFSSFVDYAGLRDGKLCNKDFAKQFFEIDPKRFYEESYSIISDEVIAKLF